MPYKHFLVDEPRVIRAYAFPMQGWRFRFILIPKLIGKPVSLELVEQLLIEQKKGLPLPSLLKR